MKNADPDEIKEAILAVVENGYYFSDFVSSIMLKSLLQKNTTRPKFKEAITLSDKETQILKLICEGHTTVEIGKTIFLSPRTVEGIRANLLEKIGVRNVAGLIMYAVKNGVV